MGDSINSLGVSSRLSLVLHVHFCHVIVITCVSNYTACEKSLIYSKNREQATKRSKRKGVTVSVTCTNARFIADRGLAARTSRSQSRSYPFLFHVLPYGFSRKREVAQSQSTNYRLPIFLCLDTGN